MYFLKCSVCDGEFNSKEKWTCHLTNHSHLIKARKKCARWSQKKRRHALVVYSTFSLSSSLGLTLLQKLSKNLLTFVTDFVWREGNSRVGVIQFESSDKLDTVLASLENPHSLRTEVDGYPVVFRRAIDLVDVEWEALVVPEVEEAESFSERDMTMTTAQKENIDDDEAVQSKKKRKRLSSKQKEQQQLEIVSSTTTTSVNPGATQPKKESLDACETSTNSLFEQLNSLVVTVKVADSALKFILGITKDVEKALSKVSRTQNQSTTTTVRVVLLRNMHLEHGDSTQNHLYLFAYVEDDSSTDPIKWTAFTCSEVFEQLQKVDCFGHPEKICFSDPKRGMAGQTFIHKESGIELVITANPHKMGDAQRYRLLNYYLTFDTRIKSIFAIIYLWARINEVRISPRSFYMLDAYRQIPDPGPLEWLLIVFLCQRKIIPTVRELQRRPHKQVRLHTGKFNMGFFEDKEFAKLWSNIYKRLEGTDEFALSVLELAGKFFLFCASLTSEPCLVNTKDGEVLPMNFFLQHETKGNSPIPTDTKLSTGELDWMRQDVNCPELEEANKPIIMTHPFNIRWRFSIDNEHFLSTVSPMMETTGNKLKQFVERMKIDYEVNQTLSQDSKINLESLLKC